MFDFVYGRVLCVPEGSSPPTASLRALIHAYVLTQAQAPRRKDGLVFFKQFFSPQKIQTKSQKDNWSSASSDLSFSLRHTL